MDQNIANIGIRRLTMSIGSAQKHKQTYSFPPDKAGDSFGKYFVVHDSTGGNHAFYFDDVSVVDEEDYLAPELPPTGWTPHRLPIAEGASSTAKATAFKTMLDTLSTKFTPAISGKVVTVEDKAAGFVIPGRDALVNAKKSGVATTILLQGYAKTAVGALSEEVSLGGMESNVKDVLTHATGETSQAKITTGFANPELTFNMLETDDASFQKAMIYIGGGVILPEFEDADLIVGWGTQSMGSAKPQFQISLHPAEAAESETKGDITIWKADFGVDSIAWNPTEFMTMPLKATLYPDTTKPPAMQFWAKGDMAWLASV